MGWGAAGATAEIMTALQALAGAAALFAVKAVAGMTASNVTLARTLQKGGKTRRPSMVMPLLTWQSRVTGAVNLKKVTKKTRGDAAPGALRRCSADGFGVLAEATKLQCGRLAGAIILTICCAAAVVSAEAGSPPLSLLEGRMKLGSEIASPLLRRLGVPQPRVVLQLCPRSLE